MSWVPAACTLGRESRLACFPNSVSTPEGVDTKGANVQGQAGAGTCSRLGTGLPVLATKCETDVPRKPIEINNKKTLLNSFKSNRNPFKMKMNPIKIRRNQKDSIKK